MEQKQEVVTPIMEKAASLMSTRHLIAYKLELIGKLSLEIEEDTEYMASLYTHQVPS